MHKHFMRDERGRVRVFKIISITLGGLVLATLLAIGLGWLVQLLWNHTIAEWFKLPMISYWQGVGLFILGKLLFGNVGHEHPAKYMHGQAMHMRAHARHWGNCSERWTPADPDEHERFHAFWEAEGKAAFLDYLARAKNEKA